MELWIRSQDRETLIKTENISIDNENYIIGNLISDDNKSICDYWRLGHYETKERALEVLNDIQDVIIAKYVTSLNSRAAMLETEEETTKALKKMAVYEMPKE